MASAAWSDFCYASSKGPYHLLGAGYLMQASVLADLDRWQRETADAMPLGVAASRRGYTLGIVDRYVGAHCPTAVGAWIREKRRWIRTPTHHLHRRGWAGVDELRHWTGTILVQALVLVSVVGLPAGLLVAWLIGSGSGTVSLSLPVLLVVGFNGLVWTYYGIRAYRAAWDALPYKSRWHQLGYSIVVNPFTHALYAAVLDRADLSRVRRRVSRPTRRRYWRVVHRFKHALTRVSDRYPVGRRPDSKAGPISTDEYSC